MKPTRSAIYPIGSVKLYMGIYGFILLGLIEIDLPIQRPLSWMRVTSGHEEFARGKCHVNGIDSFWSFAKRRLAQFNGLAEQTLYLHLKECEFRFNNRHADLYAILLRELRKNPL